MKQLVIFMFAMLTISLSAQAPTQPVMDAATKELIAAYVQQDINAAKTVQARLDAMLATPQGQAYQAALKERQEAQQVINKKVSDKVAGYIIDFATGKLISSQPQAAK